MGTRTRTQYTELSLKQAKEDEAKITTKWFRITGRRSNFLGDSNRTSCRHQND